MDTPCLGRALRDDLEISHQHRDGEARVVIKDPLTLRFYELRRDDYLLAKCIRHGATAREIADVWRREHPQFCEGRDAQTLERRATRLCTEIHRLGLCEVGAETAATAAPVAMTWGAWVQRLARRISAPLFVRVHIFDPDRLLDELVSHARPLFSKPALFLAAVFILITTVAALGHADEMHFHAGWFAVWGNLLAFYLGILVLKVIHESGHAIVCKALGGHVHEVGAQLLAFHPTFFVDVSDTWMWPERRRRIAVAAAGFGAELLAAAMLFWLWRALAPGFARDLCLNLMFVASVSAVLFNANPLMRYDGYHMLADALREPHLRRRAFATLRETLRRWVFGGRLVPRKRETRRGLLLLYATLSTAYLVWIATAVARFLDHALVPYGLEGAGRVLLGAWLLGMIVPVLGFLRGLFSDALRLSPAARVRPLLVTTALVVLLLAGAFLPVPLRVERACVVEAPASGILRAAEPGVIVEMLVREGDRVKRGQVLARLENRGHALASAQAGLEVSATRVALLSAAGESRTDEVGRQLRRFNEARATQTQAEHLADALLLMSPCDGVVLTRQPERSRGRRVRAGDEVLSIGEGGRRECLMPLTEKEARRVIDGAAVVLRSRTAPGESFAGHISAAPLRSKEGELPRALTALAGGDLAVDATGRVSSTEVTHVARFTIPTDDSRLRPGATGRARLECGRVVAWRWLLEAVFDAIHLDHRV